MRTWSNESTTFYEFAFLGHEPMAGSVVVTTMRPEQSRLQVKVTVEIDGRFGYSETTELSEHSRTGLYGVITRTMEGQITPDNLETLSSGHAEIFEYAPESALSTVCGAWISDLLGWIFEATNQDGAVEAPAPIAMAPVPPAAAEPRSNGLRMGAGRPAAPEAVPPAIIPAPAIVAQPPSMLVATTTNGDRWEVDGAETYMGRSKQCSIVLKSQRVSRKHASITREDDGFYINDLGAANGIWAGTDKVEREKIENGSEYIIGDVLVSFSYA